MENLWKVAIMIVGIMIVLAVVGRFAH